MHPQSLKAFVLFVWQNGVSEHHCSAAEADYIIDPLSETGLDHNKPGFDDNVDCNAAVTQ